MRKALCCRSRMWGVGTFVPSKIGGVLAAVAILFSLAGCRRVVDVVAPEDVAWVVVVQQNDAGRVLSVAPFVPVNEALPGETSVSGRQLLLGFTQAQLDASGAPDAQALRSQVLALRNSACEPLLPAPRWAARLSGQGRTEEIVAPESLPELTAQWLAPVCEAGFACVLGACEDRVVQVEAGDAHTCARLASGKVRCWGENRNAQGGLANFAFLTSAREVDGLDDAVEVSSGGLHSCARRAGGSVVCWGWNGDGQLGDPAGPSSADPVPVPILNDARSVSAGSAHSCAVRGDGSVWCWGANHDGQLGISLDTARSAPVRVANVADAVQVAVGRAHSCARASGGRVTCWGDNTDGKLGLGAGDGHGPNVAVAEGATSLAVARDHTCVIAGDREVFCWGRPSLGRLGGGSVTLSAPAAAISAGGAWTCALLEDGRAECWGDNDYGQRALSTLADFEYIRPSVVPIVSGAVAITLGDTFACFQDAEQTVRCWGWNGFGQLGNGTSELVTGPAFASSGAVSVSASPQSTCAVADGGAVDCWGRNIFAALGRGFRSIKETPGAVRGLGLSAEVGTGASHACARLLDGSVWCWGSNLRAQLGKETLGEPSPARVALWDDVSDLAVGYEHGCAIRGVETWCWGSNLEGQLGFGAVGGMSLPGILTFTGATQIAAGEDETCAVSGDEVFCFGGGSTDARRIEGTSGATQVEVGRYYACARLASGSVVCWGRVNDHGQLGDGTTEPHGVPAPVSGLVDAERISVGSSHACAVRANGKLSCWGDNDWHQLGDGTGLDHSIATEVPGLDGVVEVGAGVTHTCAVLADRRVMCFGWNAFGQVGPDSGSVERPASCVRGVPNDGCS